MDMPFGEIYRVRLRSLEWAAAMLRELRHSADADAVSISVNWALDGVYDLWEAYRLASSSRDKLPAQDELLIQQSGMKVGALLFIRGEKTHRAKRVDGPNPFRGLQYDFADLTHWAWADVTSDTPAFQQRATWCNQFVRHRPLWVPLEEAWYWFLTNSPIKIIGQDPREVPGWVHHISLVQANNLPAL
ncbi:hypothetical protein [Paenarthrobacter sp. NPDC089316]|uniref:hypothetical protein n=1 Tax=unclassified Paenarthrobacter TaxID=2634190 RepID=UPI00341C63CA